MTPSPLADPPSSAAHPASAALVRITPGSGGVSIWSEALFGTGASSGRLREFVSRVFAVDEVSGLEISRNKALARIRYGVPHDPHATWRKLGEAFRRSHPEAERPVHKASVDALFLDGPADFPVAIGRVGSDLSSWRVRHVGARRLRLSHPILRRRPDVRLRLHRALTELLGVQGCRTNATAGSAAIRFDPHRLSADALLRHVETLWPTLLQGLDGPPSNARLYAAGGLLGLTATGQFLVPALRPLGILGAAVYGFSNVTTAIRQLRGGQVGLPAMYTFGLGLMLLSGMPFNSALFAVLMQSWPRLGQATFQRNQRRLFRAHREQPVWAWLRRSDGSEIRVDVATIKAGDIVVVHHREVVPIDGVVVEGLAAIDEESLSGVAGAVDKAPGDAVFATGYVRGGHISVRAAGDGGQTIAGAIARLLPHAEIRNLPSSLEAERVANRNAKPALALAVASLAARQLLRPAQSIIRPDYITANRLGAQLAALYDLGDALHQGIVFRRPRALDLLAAADIYIFDDSVALERRSIAVAEIFAVDGIAPAAVAEAAAAAFPAQQNERARALQKRARAAGGEEPIAFRRRRTAGAVRYDDRDGRHVEVVSAAALALAELPTALRAAIGASAHADGFDPQRQDDDPLLRPLVVRRDGAVLGAIAFRRTGDVEGRGTIAHLRTINARARFVHLSSRSQAQADDVARALGLDTALGDLDAAEKAHVIRELGARVLWVGDGSIPGSAPALGASPVSVSVAGFRALREDKADISVLHASLTGLLPLRHIARRHSARLDADYRIVYTANLLGVAGGIAANFSGLQTGLLSNAGTLAVYLRYRRRLARLAAAFEHRRALLATAGREQEGRIETLPIHASDVEQPIRSPDKIAPGQPTEGVAGI